MSPRIFPAVNCFVQFGFFRLLLDILEKITEALSVFIGCPIYDRRKIMGGGVKWKTSSMKPVKIRQIDQIKSELGQVESEQRKWSFGNQIRVR